LAKEDGVVEDIEESGSLRVIKIRSTSKKSTAKSKAKIEEYYAPRNVSLYVEIGQKVKKGDQLFEGSLDLKELFSLKGMEAVQKYIIDEVQKIYVSNGNVINDKHIEIIVRQMFSRVMIKEAGDSNFIPGQIVEKGHFLAVNRYLRSKGKTPAKAKQLLMGITRAALTTESFLSAASFQETARVLVNAAAESKIDRLRGLKENVIIGRLIPAGTGYRKNLAKKEEGEELESKEETT